MCRLGGCDAGALQQGPQHFAVSWPLLCALYRPAIPAPGLPACLCLSVCVCLSVCLFSTACPPVILCDSKGMLWALIHNVNIMWDSACLSGCPSVCL